jgi:molybdenum cofactor biosynthesis enzyme MoaA
MGIDLKSLVRSPQAEPGVLERAVRQGVQMKPSGHCFADEGQITEHKGMNQIGG